MDRSLNLEGAQSLSQTHHPHSAKNPLTQLLFMFNLGYAPLPLTDNSNTNTNITILISHGTPLKIS